MMGLQRAANKKQARPSHLRLMSWLNSLSDSVGKLSEANKAFGEGNRKAEEVAVAQALDRARQFTEDTWHCD